MAAYAGTICAYQGNNGVVLAVTTAHRDSNGDVADVAFASAVTVDILILGYSNTRLRGVTVDGSAGTLGASIAAGQVGAIA